MEFLALDGFIAAANAVCTVLALIINELVIYQIKAIPLGVQILRRYFSGAGLLKDIPYGCESHQVLDLYTPENWSHTGDPLPLVIYVHGGSWGQGAKWQYSLMATRVCREHNVCVAVMQYALFPTQCVAGMLDDVEKCLDWALGQQSDSSINVVNAGGRGRVTLAGQSAGGHLCSLVLLHRAQQAAKCEAEDIALPNQFVSLSGVYDIEPHFFHERTRRVHLVSPMWAAMGGPENWHLHSPTQILRAHTRRRQQREGSEESSQVCSLHRWLPPMKILHCKSDQTVPVESAQNFVEALQAEGKEVDFQEFENIGHGEICVNLMTGVEDSETLAVLQCMNAWACVG